MKNLLVGLSLVLGVFFMTPAPVAHAWSWSSFFGGESSQDYGRHSRSQKWEQGSHSSGSHDSYTRSRGSSVPELDPSAAGSAIVLLLGGVALFLSRRREDHDIA